MSLISDSVSTFFSSQFEGRKYCEHDFQMLFAPCCHQCGECYQVSSSTTRPHLVYDVCGKRRATIIGTEIQKKICYIQIYSEHTAD